MNLFRLGVPPWNEIERTTDSREMNNFSRSCSFVNSCEFTKSKISGPWQLRCREHAGRSSQTSEGRAIFSAVHQFTEIDSMVFGHHCLCVSILSNDQCYRQGSANLLVCERSRAKLSASRKQCFRGLRRASLIRRIAHLWGVPNSLRNSGTLSRSESPERSDRKMTGRRFRR